MSQPLHGRATHDPHGNEAFEYCLLRDLAIAVIKRAHRDLHHRRVEVALDAALFMASDALPLWLGVAIDEDPEHLQEAGTRLLSAGGRVENDR